MSIYLRHCCRITSIHCHDMTIKKEPDDNIYCHQAPGYTAKIVKTIPYSIHIEKNNQEQYFDYPKNLKSHNINRKQIGFMKSTGCL